MARKSRNFELNSVDVIDIDAKGRGVVKHEDKVIFVPETCPGDTISLRTFKKKKNYFEGRLLELEIESKDRVEPFCQHYDDCGGCKLQHISYKKQLELKEKQVFDAITRIAKVPYQEFQPILGCDETERYRNKLEFSASNKRWITKAESASEKDFPEENGLGFHIAGRFDKILHIEKCHFQPEPSNAIRNFVYNYAEETKVEFYDPRTHQGELRSVLIRNNQEGDFMVAVMVTTKGLGFAKAVLAELKTEFPQIKSGLLIENNKVNDTIYDLEPEVVFGEAYITQNIFGLEFEVDAKSFMQTNSRQTLKLYSLAKEFAELKGDEVVYDLFCGVGTIGMYLSNSCKEVIGIETVPEAIEKANKNAKHNQIENIRFETGSVEHVMTEEFRTKYPAPDVVITDPPRMGMHQKVVDMLLKMAPEKIVYVSCNPSTQARDIALLAEKYELIKVRPVDMFPHTPHIESVALLKFKVD
jgi:23S rRNA (uracil1939-C5)-methyltransferase